jgi:hypothetical protein
LRTTFDLIEKGGALSSKALEDALNEIRKPFTRSLGKLHGRVVLKAAKPHLEERLAKFRDELKAHQEKVEKELQGQLDESRKQIMDYFVPRVVASPPDAMRRYGDVQIWVGQCVVPTPDNLAKFRTADGKPVNPAVAAAAFGTPTFLFKGNASSFVNNQGTGGAFTKTGTVTDVTPGP